MDKIIKLGYNMDFTINEDTRTLVTILATAYYNDYSIYYKYDGKDYNLFKIREVEIGKQPYEDEGIITKDMVGVGKISIFNGFSASDIFINNSTKIRNNIRDYGYIGNLLDKIKDTINNTELFLKVNLNQSNDFYFNTSNRNSNTLKTLDEALKELQTYLQNPQTNKDKTPYNKFLKIITNNCNKYIIDGNSMSYLTCHDASIINSGYSNKTKILKILDKRKTEFVKDIKITNKINEIIELVNAMKESEAQEEAREEAQEEARGGGDKKNKKGYSKPVKTTKPTITGKKEILGKQRCIYKKTGDRKEYVKYKGDLITVKDYKKIISIKKNKK